MKINKCFVLRDIFGKPMVFATGRNAVRTPLTIELNKTAEFLWKQLESEKTNTELVTALTSQYNVDCVTAKKAVDYSLEMMNRAGCLE